jgi:ABC-type iron transport system FetAB ATPase subunit
MAHAPQIEIEDLAIAFNNRTVLAGFSLRVETGEKVVLAGPSGSGKSSVLACLLGFLEPAAGHIRIQGEPLTVQSIWHLRHTLALVQQEPDLGEQTVEDWIREPFLFRANESLRGNLARLPDLLRRLRLPEAILRQKGSALSGGEKQRIASPPPCCSTAPSCCWTNPLPPSIPNPAKRSMPAWPVCRTKPS